MHIYGRSGIIKELLIFYSFLYALLFFSSGHHGPQHGPPGPGPHHGPVPHHGPPGPPHGPHGHHPGPTSNGYGHRGPPHPMPNQGPPGSGAHHGPHNPSGAPGPADPQRIQRVSNNFFFKKP